MSRIIAGIVLAIVAVSCRDVDAPTALVTPPLQIQESPSPFTEVTAGEVHAMIPDDWRPVAADDDLGPHRGFFASPRPADWSRMDGSVTGMSATWVDATRVGVPSDLYYLAATGPFLGRLTRSPRCESVSERVIADHRPSYLTGSASVGDYIARGEGTCRVHGVPTRWAYFVAAPGYGPAHKVGIPASGLYVVVAILPDSRRAPDMLHTLLHATTFNGAGVADFSAAAQAERAA